MRNASRTTRITRTLAVAAGIALLGAAVSHAQTWSYSDTPNPMI